MRYYNIQVTGGPTFTSFNNGATDPNALMVEMDVLVAPMHVPWGNSFIRIWGVSIQQISQASDLNGKNVTVYGGMQKGLPLANPAQSGLLFQGQLFQCFGNWQGTLMQLEMTIIPAPLTQAKPGNFSFLWKKGTPLSQAVATTLTNALPGYKQNINISSKLIFSEDVAGFYATPIQFAQFVQQKSQAIIGGTTYPGVHMLFQQQGVKVYDGSTASNPIQIQFTDMIGQAVWLGPQLISIKTVMRADISVGDTIKLPPGQISQTAQSMSQFRQGSVFQGTYTVTNVRQVGNSRNPDGNAWCSVFQATGPN